MSEEQATPAPKTAIYPRWIYKNGDPTKDGVLVNGAEEEGLHKGYFRVGEKPAKSDK